MPGEKRYGYGASQADRLQREHVDRFAEESGGGGGTTEAAVIQDIIDDVKTNIVSELGPSFDTAVLGHMLAGLTGTSYPTKANLVTQLTEMIVFYHAVFYATGWASLASYAGGGITPRAYTLCAAGGTLTTAIAEMDDFKTWWAALINTGVVPYLSFVPQSTLVTLINSWGTNLSAHDSTHPSAVTPDTLGSYANDLPAAMADFMDWWTDLAAGSGTGAIYVSDV